MSLIGALSTRLIELRNACGSWRKRNIKNLISIAEKNIEDQKSNPSSIDFLVLMQPFIDAYENEGEYFQIISLNTFLEFYSKSDINLYPPISVTARILKSIFETDKNSTDEIKINCCKLILTIISAPSSSYFLHGTLIYKIIVFLLMLYRVCLTDISRDTVRNTIFQIIEHFISVYRKPVEYPKFKTIEKMAEFHASILANNSCFINDYAPNSYEATIFDVDLILIIRALTKKISALEYSLLMVPTIILCCEALYKILDSDSPFTKTIDFAVVVRTDVHVSLLSLTLDTHPQLVEHAAKLIYICWSRYAPIYLQGLNDLLSHGLIPALSSSIPEIIRRAFEVFSKLIETPQFLVDAFVNYDCDHSGSFRNIFEQTVNLIVNNAYPNQITQDHQISALKTITRILSCLWKYFNQFENKETEDDEEQNLLDAKKAKDIMDHAFQLFKRSPKKGLQFFVNQSIVDNTPEAIADFLFNTPILDPAGVGEILGSESNINILKCYVEHFDFQKMSFEQAFRQFLSKFQIPGEAQMIDRVMEQFGVKFYYDNTKLFSCADTVYVLAFSTLMLHTDAHHPNVKTRMTLEEFISNNKGIDGGKDLPFSFLESLYNNITSERIFISQTTMPSSSLLTRQQLKELYQQQCKETLAFALNKTTPKGSESNRKFHRAESPNLVGPMFHIVWGKILGALTMSFEAASDSAPGVYDECIKGFELCMHIASHCYVEDALDTLVDSFAKFTRLRIHTSEVLKVKNFKCSSALIHCAIQDHNYLKGVWSIVLGEISAMDKMREDVSIAKVLIIAEQLFSETLSLDRESILDFAQSMCELARSELQENPPRAYTLIKFSDVAYYNMDRPMFIWKDIWTLIGNFLAFFGRSNDETIAATVVDIIRQLSRKFLMKKEINEFHFQQHFLQPFIDIFDGQRSLSVRKQILFCANQIVEELASVLHSGWDIIFQLLTMASLESELRDKAFSMIESIITTYISSALSEKVHLMFVLLSFVTNTRDDVTLSMAAVGKYYLISNIIESNDHDGWECLFQTLTKCTFNQNEQIRLCAEEALLSIVSDHGCMKNEFDDYLWSFFFNKIIKALFKIKPGASYSKNRLTLFKLMFDYLFFKYVDFFGRFAVDILNVLLLCCRFPNRELSFLSLKYLCNYLGDDATLMASLPDIKLFIKPLIEAVPELIKFDTGSILIVDVIERTLALCNDDPEKVKFLVEILYRMIEECNNEVACSAMKLLYKTLLVSNENDAIIEFIKKPFVKYLEIENSQADKGDWDNLIIYFIKEISKMDDLAFKKAIEQLSDIIQKLIEVESSDVRKEIGIILRKKLVD
ncbi:Sec7 domain containing protein [Tritrichomonas foetus]|uniref:Sec7 domain containing protein n=1 Tax=Tritrichomonas foetus TaxID=1144522 RepID=A0A1J4JDL0_9EUKA|nr:Sec7 domain containing protein [Tritrichomonas foetus]|eukprot:OHS96375.1 Sec7 domain containing protein [Tritrichomonas foetus]